MLYHHRPQRPITATTQMHHNIQTNRTLIPQPSPILWGNHCGSDDRDCHTQPRRTIVPKKVATPLAPCCVPRPRHHDGVSIPDAGIHPHRETMHKQHTLPRSSRCVPFSDPHVHKVTRSNETRQGCNHSSASTLWPFRHLARTHQADDKSK